MKRILLLLALLVVLNSVSVLGTTERVINQTSCSVVNNGGTGLNTIGQSFKFNSSLGSTARLSAVEFGWANSSGVSTLTAGTTFNFSVHYNESVAGSTIVSGCSYINATYTTAVGVSCGTSVILNLTAFNSSCILNTTGGGGNYTFEVTISGEGASSQLWTIENSGDPYTSGKCYGCGGGGGSFIAGNDLVFRIYADSVSTPASTSYFSLTATDTVTLASISTFNATVNGTFFSTTNGTIVTTFNSTAGNVSIIINATDYFGNSSTNWNMSLANYSGNLTPIRYFNITARNTFTLGALTTFNATVNGTHYTTTNGTIYTNILMLNGLVNVTEVNASGFYINSTLNYNTSAGYLANLTPINFFNITAKDSITNVALTTFNATINGTLYTTTNGTIVTTIPQRYGNVSITGVAPYYFTNTTATYNASRVYVLNLTQWTALYVKTVSGSTSITNFSANYTNTTATYSGLSTTTSVIYIPLYNGSWNVTIYNANELGTNYSTGNATLNATTYLRNYTFYIYTTNAFNITFRHEINDSILYSNLIFGTDNIQIEFISDSASYNYTANGTLYVDLLVPEDYVIRYHKTGYGRQRQYFVTLTNQSYNIIDLFLLPNSSASDLTVTVYDATTLQKIVGAIVYLQRYNVSLNAYRTVAMYETDIGGNAYFDVEQQNELYKFVVQKPFKTTIFTSEPLYIESTDINIYVPQTQGYADEFFNLSGISGNIIYSNGSGTPTFTLSYSDPSIIASNYCFSIKTWGRYSKELINWTCSSSASGSIDLTGLTYGKTYYAVFDVTIGGQNKTIATAWKELPTDLLGSGRFGMFLTLGLFIVSIFLVPYHSYSALIGSLILALSKLLGIFALDWGYIIVMIIGSIMLMIFLEKR